MIYFFNALQIHVVDEKRFYSNFMSVEGKSGNGLVNDATGVIKARRVLNNLHTKLGNSGFNEV